MRKSLYFQCSRLLIVFFLFACVDKERKDAEKKNEPTAEQLKELEKNSNCSSTYDDFLLFRDFAYREYVRKITRRSIRELELTDLLQDDGIVVKTWGHALSQQLNYLKAGTPQYERWKMIEEDFQTYLVCIASYYGMHVLRYSPATEKGPEDERLTAYQDEIDELWRGAIAGKYDDEVAERTKVGEGSVASYFGEKDDWDNTQDILPEAEKSIQGYWRNTSMRMGSSEIVLINTSQYNTLDIHSNREYDYSAHTQGADPVITRGNWRYYKNGPGTYLALEHTMQKKDGAFQPIARKRETVFLIKEFSAGKMLLFEEKEDPGWSVTLVYEKK